MWQKKKPQPTNWHFKMAATEVGAKVIFDENGLLCIFFFKRRMMSNVRISLSPSVETTTTGTVTGFFVLSTNFLSVKSKGSRQH